MIIDRTRPRLLFLRTLRVVAGPLVRLWSGLPSFPVRSPAEPERRPRLLVVRPDHLGDVLLATPALRLLRRHYPRAAITCLVGPWARPVLQGNPDVDRVLACPFPGFTRQHGPTNRLAPYLLVLHYALLLRRTGPYDAAVILRDDHWWGALLVFLAGIPVRAGVGQPESAPFLTHTLSPEDLAAAGAVHRAEQSLALTRLLLTTLAPDMAPPTGLPLPAGPDQPLPSLRAPLSPGDVQAVSTLLASRNIAPGQRMVAVQAGAGAAIKLWSSQAFAAVAVALAREQAAVVLLVGTAAERDLAREIAAAGAALDAQARIEVLAGETSWAVLTALLDRCALVVGVDSGPLHLAVARGRPSVTIFGPIDPRLFGPWGDSTGAAGRHAVVATVPALPCQPCGRLDYCALQPRGGPLPVPCLRAVTPARVLAAARQVMMRVC